MEYDVFGKFSILLIIGAILAASSLRTAYCAQTFTSGVSAEHADGVVSRIVERLAQKLEIRMEMRLAPFARRLQWMKTGDIDIMGGILKRPQREAYIFFVSPPYVNENRKVFFVRRGEEHRIDHYEDLYGLRIGTKIHARYFPRFDKDERLNKEAVGSVELNFKKLLADRLDAVIYSNRSGFMKLMEMGLTDRVGRATYIYKKGNPVYIGISRHSPLMKDKARVEAAVREMVETEEIKRIIKNYYKPLGKRPLKPIVSKHQAAEPESSRDKGS
jgi:polar amino acid transport system substrate-binding protein